MEKQIHIDQKKEIEFAAECLARILIQQIMNKKNLAVSQEIETKYGKRNK